jgi:hypothetical protein
MHSARRGTRRVNFSSSIQLYNYSAYRDAPHKPSRKASDAAAAAAAAAASTPAR